MIISGTHPPISIDLGKDEPGMKLQRIERGVWQDVIKDGELVLSPVDLEALPPGKYRLVG